MQKEKEKEKEKEKDFLHSIIQDVLRPFVEGLAKTVSSVFCFGFCLLAFCFWLWFWFLF